MLFYLERDESERKTASNTFNTKVFAWYLTVIFALSLNRMTVNVSPARSGFRHNSIKSKFRGIILEK